MVFAAVRMRFARDTFAMNRLSESGRNRGVGSSRRKARTWLRPSAEVLESRQLLARGILLGSFHTAAGDTSGPGIQAIQVPAPRTYATSATLAFRVVFDEPVIVTGSPSLPVEVGLGVQQAELVGNAGRTYTRSLVFKTRVNASTSDDNGIALGTVGVRNGMVVRLLNGAEGIRDRAGNAADPALPATVDARRVLVDAVGPGVQSYGFRNLPAGTIQAGERIAVEVRFDQPVTVAGRPTIPFQIGETPADLVHVRGSGTRSL